MPIIKPTIGRVVHYNSVPHPIPYQGSKRNIADDILCHFPTKIDRLVEPFAGSAAISLATATRGIAESYWLNDAHEPLVDLWKAIVTSPKSLLSSYENLWYAQEGKEREFYDEVRAKFNRTKDTAAFLYLLARCVKAAIRYNRDGEFNNSPDNRRKGARPATMKARVIGASQLLEHRNRITCLDYREVLKQCTEADLVYMDPPYQGVCGKRDNRYAPSVVHSEFCDELADLVRRKIAFAVSYDGRSGDRTYGEPLPASLGLLHLEIDAGVSTQATLLGRSSRTFESLYLSPILLKQTKKTKSRKAFVQSTFAFDQEETQDGPRTAARVS